MSCTEISRCCVARAQRYPRAKSVGRLLQELHLTLFPQGKPRAKCSFAQLEVINMKTRQSRRQTTKVSHSRWLAYASASAATALAGSHSAEAAIHYSGSLRVHFPPDENTTKTFPLLHQPGDLLWFQRASYNLMHFQHALFSCFGSVSG